MMWSDFSLVSHVSSSLLHAHGAQVAAIKTLPGENSKSHDPLRVFCWIMIIKTKFDQQAGRPVSSSGSAIEAVSAVRATRRRAASRGGMSSIARCHLQKYDMLSRVTSASLSGYHGSIGQRNLGFVISMRRRGESIVGTGWTARGTAARRSGRRGWIWSSRAIVGSYRCVWFCLRLSSVWRHETRKFVVVCV